MPGGKKKGSPKKGNQTTTRSKIKQQKQQRKIESLSLLSTPVAASRNLKKLSTLSEDQKQAAVDSAEHERTIAQVVTETKQNKANNKTDHSTGSDLTDLPVTQVNTTINLSSMADSRLDAKLKHLLTNYFLAIGNNHEI